MVRNDIEPIPELTPAIATTPVDANSEKDAAAMDAEAFAVPPISNVSGLAADIFPTPFTDTEWAKASSPIVDPEADPWHVTDAGNAAVARAEIDALADIPNRPENPMTDWHCRPNPRSLRACPAKATAPRPDTGANAIIIAGDGRPSDSIADSPAVA